VEAGQIESPVDLDGDNSQVGRLWAIR
jgi:hypothetical protein